MTGNQSFFSQLSFSDFLPPITLTNGSQIKVHGIGQIPTLPHLPLHSVLFVPYFPFNLITISKLTRTLNFSVFFVNNFFLIQDRRTGQKIRAGHEYGGLYRLSPLVGVSPPLSILLISVLVILVWRDCDF
uniref:Retrovirus-related Pol polyprotein from transposon TNT 1-94-like beta-barrel domain-containing protein n=1 Tax=Cajanus cajan TaxID=3821 RepID=A0A151R7Q1_CAJCA|nr:hypothetical protein KK1_040078 [Cajanus cajan]